MLHVSSLYMYLRPLMEYCCHIWAGASASHLSLLDRVQKCIAEEVEPMIKTTIERPCACFVTHILLYERISLCYLTILAQLVDDTCVFH